jgi:hypothetical protein
MMGMIPSFLDALKRCIYLAGQVESPASRASGERLLTDIASKLGINFSNTFNI